ncbi:cell division protein FtsZ [Methanopyrus kandleri]|uniref:Cell division protein FtsZ n=2 Tax=Methanopyrus kandleri TaxID=2320 RepID=Q8TX55_METKA|nr:cell division protein FtsZ [Methanopyrus kandleri]AAM02034.1 FtsZ GTPase involved in cell division [Methanopyrus kandleri AV19]
MEQIVKNALERVEREQGGDDPPSSRGTDDDQELMEVLERARARILVVGVGGAGNNTATRLKEEGIGGAEVIAINTDAQDLVSCKADRKVLIGYELTRGLGAGGDPRVGEEAAKEDMEKIKEVVEGADMVFVTCGLGGGTGTGAAPIIAEVARKEGALTIGVVTLPFSVEGRRRIENALEGLERLRQVADTCIVIPNDRLLEIVPDLPIAAAFKVADEVLINAVKGITEMITQPGLMNLDFADVRAVMENGGFALIGIGEAENDSESGSRAVQAVENALNNPLVDVEVSGATGALVNIVGGKDLTLKEAEEVVELVASELSEDATVIWGAQIDEDLNDVLRVTVIVTGIEDADLEAMFTGPRQPKRTEVKEVAAESSRPEKVPEVSKGGAESSEDERPSSLEDLEKIL